MQGQESPVRIVASDRAHGSLLRALVVCDLAGSTALVERLGDRVAARLMQSHDQLARAAMRRHGGREIDKADGFLLLFDRPVQAISFALEYQREVKALAEESKQALRARVGIHVGDVVAWDNDPADVNQGAKITDIEGLAKPIAARLMALALPNQILVSGVTYALTQHSKRELVTSGEGARWLAYGRYRVKGLADPIAVFEIGEPGVAPLRRPPNSPYGARTALLWRRPAVAFVIVALVAALGFSFYFLDRSEPALPFAERDWVVIGDLVNINADKSLEAPLQTAFRIGMEESPFINVLPEQEVRQTLVRMQRDAATRVDRNVAAEIAVREDARAVIIPSVAQVGGKLRLSAELIDPVTARTVSIQTADVEDRAEALSALDQLLRRTRSTLGESLKQIGSTSQPLEKVTTPNLEALRAFSGATDAERDGDFEQARTLLVYATELDPSFATAYERLGAVLVAQDRYSDASAALEKALSFETRLIDRDRLYIRAFTAMYNDPRTALALWRAYADLYPDSGIGQANSGIVWCDDLHDYRRAETAFREAARVGRSSFRNYTLQSLGRVLLAEERRDEAEQEFRAALSVARTPFLFELSDALLLNGKFEEAARYLEDAERESPEFEVERGLRRATLLIARGRIDAAAEAIEGVLAQASGLPAPNGRWRAEAAAIALRVAQGDESAAKTIAARYLAELSKAAQPDVNRQAIEELLYGAAWAARLGLEEDARKALAIGHQYGALDHFPVRAGLAVIAQAEVDLRGGHADRVLSLLQPGTAGSDLWEFHEVRARALRALGRSAEEEQELRWLATHRGLALAEWTDGLLGQQARAIVLQQQGLWPL